MRVSNKIVIDLTSGTVLERECFEYFGPVAGCISFGGSQSKQKNKSQQTSSSQSGTRYNEDFLNRALEFASGKQSQSRENFDAGAYLKAHPDVAADTNYAADPYQHYLDFGKNDPSGNYTFTPKFNPNSISPTYAPDYKESAYTPGAYTSVAPGGFDKLEKSLYEGQQSKLAQAYNQSLARQREELAQSGALNSPAQYLEGSARSSLDRDYLSNLQQAARDAFQGRLGLETAEAGRKTAFDVGEAGRRTAFDLSEAERRTGFNEQTAARILDLWLKKLGIALEAGRYSEGQGQGTSSGSGSQMGGNFGLFKFAGD